VCYLAKRLFFGKIFYYLKSQIYMRDVVRLLVTELWDNMLFAVVRITGLN